MTDNVMTCMRLLFAVENTEAITLAMPENASTVAYYTLVSFCNEEEDCYFVSLIQFT